MKKILMTISFLSVFMAFGEYSAKFINAMRKGADTSVEIRISDDDRSPVSNATVHVCCLITRQTVMVKSTSPRMGFTTRRHVSLSLIWETNMKLRMVYGSQALLPCAFLSEKSASRFISFPSMTGLTCPQRISGYLLI